MLLKNRQALYCVAVNSQLTSPNLHAKLLCQFYKEQVPEVQWKACVRVQKLQKHCDGDLPSLIVKLDMP